VTCPCCRTHYTCETERFCKESRMKINIPKFEDIRHERARRDYENNPYINRVNKLERDLAHANAEIKGLKAEKTDSISLVTMRFESELAEAKSRSDELKEWGETTIEKLEQERDAYSKRLGEAQAEIKRLRNIPMPPNRTLLGTPGSFTSGDVYAEWLLAVQHYESHLRPQKREFSVKKFNEECSE
jgi:hypothetical protein